MREGVGKNQRIGEVVTTPGQGAELVLNSHLPDSGQKRSDPGLRGRGRAQGRAVPAMAPWWP